MTFGSSGCYARRFLGCYVVAIMLLASPAARTAELTFDQAAECGMVDMAANKPPSENAELFAHLHEIDPGIIDGFAFDACEKPPNPSPAYTEYNAVRCGDLPTIREALHEHDVR